MPSPCFLVGAADQVHCMTVRRLSLLRIGFRITDAVCRHLTGRVSKIVNACSSIVLALAGCMPWYPQFELIRDSFPEYVCISTIGCNMKTGSGPRRIALLSDSVSEVQVRCLALWYYGSARPCVWRESRQVALVYGVLEQVPGAVGCNTRWGSSCGNKSMLGILSRMIIRASPASESNHQHHQHHQHHHYYYSYLLLIPLLSTLLA